MSPQAVPGLGHIWRDSHCEWDTLSRDKSPLRLGKRWPRAALEPASSFPAGYQPSPGQQPRLSRDTTATSLSGGRCHHLNSPARNCFAEL